MSAPSEWIASYRIVRELGRGGMGVVYEVEHPRLGRRALKLLLDPGPEHRARFQIEAEAVATLRHPHVVQIHEAGVHGAAPYLVLDLVEGESLDQRIKRDGPLPEREAADLIRCVAEAVDEAHRRGFLHRDIKPANVLVDAQGQALLTDFGLARQLQDERERLTRSGQLLGTPAYMAPEQAAGDHELVSFQSDVYALGATLYALLVGHAPFQGATAINIIAKVLRKDPPPPSSLRPGLDHELETVVLQCLAKDPAHRYTSAEALAGDLKRWLAQGRIRARRPTVWQRARRRAYVYRRQVAIVLAGAAMLGLGLWGLSGQLAQEFAGHEGKVAAVTSLGLVSESKLAAHRDRAEELGRESAARREARREAPAMLAEAERLLLGGYDPRDGVKTQRDPKRAARLLAQVEDLFPEEFSLVPVLRAGCELSDETLEGRGPIGGRGAYTHVRGEVTNPDGVSADDCQRALKLLAEGARRGSDDPRLPLWQAMASRLLGLAAPTIEFASQAIERAPAPDKTRTQQGFLPILGQAYRLRASGHYCAGDYQAARQDIEAAVNNSLHDIDTWMLQGTIYMALGELRLAQECFTDVTKFAQSNVTRVVALLPRAECSLRLGDREQALADLNAAVELDVDDTSRAWALCKRAEALGQHDPAQALADVERALDLVPNYLNALLTRGMLRLDHGDMHGAQADLGRVLEFDPQNAGARLDHGHVLRNLGERARDVALLDEALADYQRAFDLEPTFTAALFGMGETARFLGRHAEAAQHYGRGIELCAELGKTVLPLVYLRRADCYLQTGQHEMARQDLTEEAVQRDPNLALRARQMLSKLPPR